MSGLCGSLQSEGLEVCSVLQPPRSSKNCTRQKLDWHTWRNRRERLLRGLPVNEYNHSQCCVKNLSKEEIGNPFQRPTLHFFKCPLSTVVKLKFAGAAHRFQGIESISMQMIPSYSMRLTDPDNAVYHCCKMRDYVRWWICRRQEIIMFDLNTLSKCIFHQAYLKKLLHSCFKNLKYTKRIPQHFTAV